MDVVVNPTRVVIISQDATIRTGLRAALEQDGIVVAGEGANGHQGLTAVRELRPNLVLVDSELPGLTGCAITATIKRSFLGVQVILLAPVADFDHLAEGMWCGATTAMRRDADPAAVRRTVRAVVEEHQRLHPWPIPVAGAEFADGFVPDEDRLIQRWLTDRQAAVLDCMVMGLTGQQMPAALGTTRYRVRTELDGLLKSLGVNRRISAVALAIERGWTSVGSSPAVVTVEQPAGLSGSMNAFLTPEWAPLAHHIDHLDHVGRGDVRGYAM